MTYVIGGLRVNTIGYWWLLCSIRMIARMLYYVGPSVATNDALADREYR